MTTVEALRLLRRTLELTTNRCALFIVFDELPRPLRAEVEAVLEETFTPSTAAADRMGERFAKTGTDGDGRAALALARMPAAQVRLWDWLEAPERRLAEVLKGFDAAILRAGRSR